MELWWNLDILWWNLDRFEHKFDGNITNWPCWSEGKLGTGPFTWLGQGFQTNFSEIPFQKRENLSIYGQNYGQLRSITDFWRSFNRSKIGLIFTPVFCNASRNTWGQQPEWLAWWKSSFGRMKRVWGSELWGWLPMGLTSYELRVKDPAPPSPLYIFVKDPRAAFEICNSNIHISQSSKNILSHSVKAARLWGWLPYPWVHRVHFCFFWDI